MPSPLAFRRRSLAVAAALLVGLIGTLILAPGASAASCTTTPTVSVATWDALKSAIESTTCAAPNTFTVTLTADVQHPGTGTGIRWDTTSGNSGRLVLQGDTTARRTIDMHLATTYFLSVGGGINQSVTLRNLTVRNARTPDGSTMGEESVVYVGQVNETLTIDNCLITDNQSFGPTVNAKLVPSLVVTDSTISGNTASGSPANAADRQRGGAIYANQNLTLTRSSLIDNTTSGNGSDGGAGAWVQGGSVNMTESTVSGNHATATGSTGGGIRSAAAGVAITITRSTISGNTAAGDGGGIYLLGGTSQSIVNSTIAGNASTGGAGGGIYSASQDLILVFSTIAGNTASTAGTGAVQAATIKGTGVLVASSSATKQCTYTASNLGYSAQSTSADCFATSGTAPTIAFADMALGTLQDNGGPTWTIRPGAGSLINGSATTGVSWKSPTYASDVTTDQRNVSRGPDPSSSARWTYGAVQLATTATLSSLVVTAGGSDRALTPAFSPGSGGPYAASSVAHAVTSATVTPTRSAAVGAPAITVNGAAVATGVASSPIALSVGTNTIAIAVAPERGGAATIYTVTIARAAPSADAALSGLSLSSGTLSPTFSSGTSAYTAGVGNATTSITVTPTVNEANATVTVDGVATTSGSASAPITLNVGANAIPIVVTAQDATTTQTYTVTITRAPSSDAALSNLALSTGTLAPTFASGTTTYSANVANTTATLTITPTANQPDATITVDGNATTSGTASNAITLNVGANAIPIVVTAQDATTTQTYTVTITRADPDPSPVTPSSGSSNDTTPATPASGGTTTPATGSIRIVSAAPTAGTSAISVTVRTTIAGRLRMTGTVPRASLRATARKTICSARVVVRKAGAYRLRCNLRPGIRRVLARHALTVRITTRLAIPTGGVIVRTRTLRLRKLPAHGTPRQPANLPSLIAG